MRTHKRVRAAAILCAVVVGACAESSSPDAGAAAPAQDAGAVADAAASHAQPIATATALLSPTASATAMPPAEGTATFRSTLSGVDLEVKITGCMGPRPYALSIVDAADCSEASLRAAPWARSEGIAGVRCAGTTKSGRGVYTRRNHEDDPWTIGGDAKSNVIGRALLLLDADSLEPIACGAIERGDDLVRVAPPALDQPPRVEVRAAVSGLCLAKMLTAKKSLTCPDPVSMAECVAEHCDLGSCLERCSGYTECLEQSGPDPCANAFSCPPAADCQQCQSELWLCTSAFCTQELSCAPPIAPDGPCAKLEACCALQGEGAASCLSLIQVLEAISGDASCLGGMNDWDLLSHMHVPCKFEE